MPAVQLATTNTPILAAAAHHRRVTVQNLGPNAIYLEIGAAAATATGYQVPATTGVRDVELPAGSALNGIAATALQASPADTRYLVR